MKTIMCIDCEKQFTGETPEDVMKAMMPHYMSDHKEVMDKGNEEERTKWMAEFNKRWGEV